MGRIPGCLVLALISFSALAEHHDAVKAEVTAAAEAFNTAYATNDVETYFGFYTDDAVLYFFGARQKVLEYKDEWTASIEAGGGVEKNDMSDLYVQIMPGADVAVATYFVDNRSRAADGTTTEAKAFETDIWQKIDGKWRVVGLHYSEIAPE